MRVQHEFTFNASFHFFFGCCCLIVCQVGGLWLSLCCDSLFIVHCNQPVCAWPICTWDCTNGVCKLVSVSNVFLVFTDISKYCTENSSLWALALFPVPPCLTRNGAHLGPPPTRRWGWQTWLRRTQWLWFACSCNGGQKPSSCLKTQKDPCCFNYHA